jgi:pyruvate dehydrogenase E1 component beta subunit
MKSIYLMGEEVAEYNGAYKASKGMLDEFGPKRVIDTPIAEVRFCWNCSRFSYEWVVVLL